MKLNDNINNPMKGIFNLKTIDHKTGEVLDEFEDLNVIVLDAKEAIIKAISSTSGEGIIDDIKFGDDTGTTSMTGTPNITFADAGVNDTITRNTGSFVDDGFIDEMSIVVTGSTSNNSTFTVLSVTDTTITLSSADSLTNEGPVGGVSISGTASPNNPITAVDTYDETTMSVIFDASYTLTVGYPNATSVTFSTTLLGVDVMALYPGETSKIITSAALHTGNLNVFAYKRYPQKSISEVIDIAVSWTIAY